MLTLTILCFPWAAASPSQEVEVPTESDAGGLFEEIGEQALPGVEMVCGSMDKRWLLEVNGGGLVLGDFNGDGVCDLVLIRGSTVERVSAGKPGLAPELFLGVGDGRFEAAGGDWAMRAGHWGMGGTAGDVNADGWLDLIITEWGPDRVFLNRKGEGFAELEQGAGLAREGWSTSAALLDYDGDGLLDLVVVGYLEFDPKTAPAYGSAGCRWKGHPVLCGPEGFTATHDRLYRGLGDGRFEDVSVEAGFRPDRPGFGLGVMTADLDADGDTDIYVANDSTPNHLWENLGQGKLREVGWKSGCALDANGREQAGMGIAVGDLNSDGKQDLWVTNFSGEANALYLARGSGRFRERANAARVFGPSLARLGWGTGAGDLDLDGDLDLWVLNGHVYPEADRAGTDTRYAQADQLFLAQGRKEALRFEERLLSEAAPAVSRAGAQADLDGDGDLDLVALSVGGPVRVLLNRVQEEDPRHWLAVELEARGGNRQALGAQLTLAWEGGTQCRELRTCGGFQAAVPARVHFGLGSSEHRLRLHIRWPSGQTQMLEDPGIDRLLRVREPEEDD